MASMNIKSNSPVGKLPNVIFLAVALYEWASWTKACRISRVFLL
jgi:hypothetical protein